ncbi:MAG TPA: ABC transporter substrate-binding protein [Acidimicrobiia bacterium]|jgi:branched-chain amino acid transport system substrate-binding protein
MTNLASRRALRSMAAVLVAVLGASGLAACSGTAAGAGDVVIGALYPTQGDQGAGGTQELHGVELAVDWVNAHGGINGRDVHLVTESVSRPEAVPEAMSDLASHHVVAVLGSHSSEVSAVAAEEATQLHMSFWETGAVGMLPKGVATGTNFFRLAPSGATLGHAAIHFVSSVLTPQRKLQKNLRYTVTYVDDAYGRSVGAGAIAEIHKAGLTLAAAIGYDPNHFDPTAVAKKVAAAHTDVLFASAYIDDGVAVQRALAHLHVPLKVAIGTSSSYCTPQFGQMLGAGAVGVFASDKPDADHVREAALQPEARTQLEWASTQYATKYNAAMSSYALSGFSNTLVVLGHVLPAAHSLSVADIARAAHTVHLAPNSLPNGGGYDLAPDSASDAGDNVRAESVIWQWVAPVTPAVVYPPSYATHTIADLRVAA